MLQQLDFYAKRYTRQTLFAFSKLAKLSFEKGHPNNVILIARIRAVLSTLKYDYEPEVDIATEIFQIGILFKRSKFFTMDHMNQQLMKEVQNLIRDKEERKCFSNLIKTFFNIFK